MKNKVFVVTSIAAVASVIAVIFLGIQLRGEIVKRENLENLVLAREPKVGYLKPFMQEAGESFWVVIPITNKAISVSGVAHRVQVSVTFGIDNPIKRIDADPFVVADGPKGGHSANLELSVLYPGTVVYASFLVENAQLPEQIVIGWAEKTGMQIIPLVEQEAGLRR